MCANAEFNEPGGCNGDPAITFSIGEAGSSRGAFFNPCDPIVQKRPSDPNFRGGIIFYRWGYHVGTLFLRCISLNTGFWRLFDIL